MRQAGLEPAWGRPVEEIVPGDVIWFAPGKNTGTEPRQPRERTHIAVQEGLDGKTVEWFEHVSGKQYQPGS